VLGVEEFGRAEGKQWRALEVKQAWSEVELSPLWRLDGVIICISMETISFFFMFVDLVVRRESSTSLQSTWEVFFCLLASEEGGNLSEFPLERNQTSETIK